MKGSILGILGVVIIVIVAGVVLFRSDSQEVRAPTSDEPAFVDESDSDLDDFSAQPTNLGGDVSEENSATLPTQEEEQASDDAQGETVIISMTDSGFEPSEVEIDAGTTVTFRNNGQAMHWPASDVHPTHEILPEFDSERGLATGETYSYTFAEAGTWAMHDHLFPRFVGEITVR